MKTKLLSLLLVTLLLTLIGSIIPATPASATGEAQQIWFITDTLTLAASPGAGTGHASISPPQALCTSLTATEAITIPAGHWRGYISLNSAYTGNMSVNIGYGAGENVMYVGTHDLPIATYQTGFLNGLFIDIDAGSMSMVEGDAIYLRFNGASGTPDIATGGIHSYISSPSGSPSFPTPGQIIRGLTMSVNGNGTTTPSASATAYNYYVNTVVPVLATAASGNHFIGWSGGSLTGTTNPTSVTLDLSRAVTANFTAPVDLVLVTDAEPAVVDDTFDVVLQAQSGSQNVVGIDAYLNFDPAKLAVVDANSEAPGIQIATGTTLTQVIQNSADNTTGHINYCAGVLGESYPSGTFTVATIHFKALAATSPTTDVTFSTSIPRKTYASGDIEGTEVTGSLTGQTYTIAAKIDLNVSVTLQGTNRPDSAWLLPLTVKFFTPDADVFTASPRYSFTLTSTKVGSTALIRCTGIQPGNYDISAVSSHTLLNVKKNVTINVSTTGVSLGTLLEGNATNDDRVNIADFAILSGAYGQLSTDPDYDPLADFDGNFIVNIADFSLLSGNYNQIAPIEIH